MLITKIQKVRRARNLYDISVDGQPAFRVSETLLVKARLATGDKIDDARLAQLEADSRLEVAYRIALNYISYRPRSSKEVLTKLERAGIARDAAQQAIERLKEQKLLDDVTFAQMFIRDKLKGKPMGKALMRKKLLEKGITFQLSERILKEFVTVESEQEAARKLLNRKLKTSSRRFEGLDAPTRQKKLTEYLLQRGFSFDIASKTVRSISR